MQAGFPETQIICKSNILVTVHRFQRHAVLQIFYHLDGLNWGRGVLVAAQVDHHPGDVAQERDGDLGVDETQQRLNNSKGNDVISQGRAVTNNVTYGGQNPNVG